MTEQDWFESDDLYRLISITQITKRQQLLFGVACCRHVQHLISDKNVLRCLSLVESHADKNYSKKELRKYWEKTHESGGALLSNGTNNANLWAMRSVYNLTSGAVVDAANAVSCALANVSYSSYLFGESTVYMEEYRWQIYTLRHITGNPFKSKPNVNISTNIQNLATAMYEGENCHFALHDALIDEGYFDLADHFRGEYHPKGCWVLDLLKW